MTYRALTDFAGAVTMTEGEVRELPRETADELIRTGHIAPVGEPQEVTESESIGNNTRRRKKPAKDRL